MRKTGILKDNHRIAPHPQRMPKYQNNLSKVNLSSRSPHFKGRFSVEDAESNMLPSTRVEGVGNHFACNL
jgi:hypothetical protein